MLQNESRTEQTTRTEQSSRTEQVSAVQCRASKTRQHKIIERRMQGGGTARSGVQKQQEK